MKPPFVNFKKKRSLKNIDAGSFIFEVGEHAMLRKKSSLIPLSRFNSAEIKTKFKYVKTCLIRYRKITGYGRGLTAVQVGIPLRFSAIYSPATIQNKKMDKNVSYEDILIVANPKILKVSKELLKYPEMCMSLSPVIVPTIRPAWIEFEYYDETGVKHLWNTKSDTAAGMMMNRVLMHELDHIDGIINIDKIIDPKEIILQADPDFYSSAKFEKVRS